MSDKRDSHRLIKQIAEEQQEAFLRRSSIRFLECAIHLCATHMTLDEVASLLEAEADQLRRFS